MRVVNRVDLKCFDHKKKEKGNYMRWKMCELTLLWKFFYSILCCCYLVAQSSLTLLRPHGLSPIRLLCPWDFPGKNTGVGCISFSRGSYWPMVIPVSPALAGWFFTTEPPEKFLVYIYIYIYQIITWYALNFHNILYELYFSKSLALNMGIFFLSASPSFTSSLSFFLH